MYIDRKKKPGLVKRMENLEWIGFGLLLVFLLALGILWEAKRVHTEIWGEIHSLQYLHEGGHNGN